jgi:hypothetical protein
MTRIHRRVVDVYPEIRRIDTLMHPTVNHREEHRGGHL